MRQRLARILLIAAGRIARRLDPEHVSIAVTPRSKP